MAHRTLGRVCDELPGTDLAEVMAMAELQTRVDRKYLVPARDFRRVIDRLAGRYAVLEIDDRRLFDYESVYFDTPDLLAYHQHAYGRRRRFKLRTRTYLDSAQTLLEVKTEGGRGETVKDRHPYQLADRYRLDDQARAVAAQSLGDADLAQRLDTSLVTRYRRATLVDPRAGNRLTCDVDLTFDDARRTAAGPRDLVLVESKTAAKAAAVDTALWRLGHRPVSISKYCVGLALLYPWLPANRWHRTMRRYFAARGAREARVGRVRESQAGGGGS